MSPQDIEVMEDKKGHHTTLRHQTSMIGEANDSRIVQKDPLLKTGLV